VRNKVRLPSSSPPPSRPPRSSPLTSTHLARSRSTWRPSPSSSSS
jgi:hypothetical protein